MKKWIVEWFPQYGSFVVEVNDDITFEDLLKYEPTYIPDGFTLVEETVAPLMYPEYTEMMKAKNMRFSLNCLMGRRSI